LIIRVGTRRLRTGRPRQGMPPLFRIWDSGAARGLSPPPFSFRAGEVPGFESLHPFWISTSQISLFSSYEYQGCENHFFFDQGIETPWLSRQSFTGTRCWDSRAAPDPSDAYSRLTLVPVRYKYDLTSGFVITTSLLDYPRGPPQGVSCRAPDLPSSHRFARRRPGSL